MSKERAAAESGTLAKLRASQIERNPHNPRILFDPEPMSILKQSIESTGILVPILVYRKTSVDPKNREVEFVILDGERRWLCAQEIERETGKSVPIPANIIAEPSTLANILTMFNIHQVREPWELTPTALKLQVVMRYLKGKTPKELAELTGLTEANVRRCQLLLSFDKQYLDMTLRQVRRRIPGDFFVQLHPVLGLLEQRYPELYRKLGRNGITDRLIEKYEGGEITAVTEFRDFANLIRAQDIGALPSRIKRVVEDLITTPDSIRAAYKRDASDYLKAERVRLSVERLTRSLKRIDLSKISKRSPVFASLRDLRNTIDKILETGN